MTRRVDLARHRRSFDDVERYLTFVGHPRNASTLVGAMLDAHPDAVVCHELGALDHVGELGRDEFLYRHLVRSRWFAQHMRCRWEGYDYRIDERWQGGRYRRLRVVGDKRARLAATVFGMDPTAVDRLRDRVGVPLVFVHVVRDPLDNLATILRRREGRRPPQRDVDAFVARCDAIARLRSEHGDAVIDVHQEDLVSDPHGTLASLATAVGLDPVEGWLDASAHRVFPSVPRTARSIEWPAGLEAAVRERVQVYDWFDRYA